MVSNRIFRSILTLVFLFSFAYSYASDMSSTNFIIRDPIIGTMGGYGSSSNFQLISSGNITLSGANVSSSYVGREGFLYYPFTVVTPPTSGGSVGGGGGGPIVYQSGVKFSGSAYPNAVVTVLKGLSKVASVTADQNGAFDISIPENDSQLFSIFATDIYDRQSTLLNFPTFFRTGYLTDITGIRFAPTISLDKSTVKKDDYLKIEGMALPLSSIEIAIDGSEFGRFNLEASSTGSYSINIPINLKEGEYTVKVHYSDDGRWSKAIRISVGNMNIFENESRSDIPGDCNADQNVTLADFSILAYWFGKNNPPKCVDTNNDDVVNIIDFSILAFYWNG